MPIKLKKFILEKRKEGRLVVMGIEGPISMDIKGFIRQSADGILYDLNRLEEISLTFLDRDRKWVNDFAVALTIRELKANIINLETERDGLREFYDAYRELRSATLDFNIQAKLVDSLDEVRRNIENGID